MQLIDTYSVFEAVENEEAEWNPDGVGGEAHGQPELDRHVFVVHERHELVEMELFQNHIQLRDIITEEKAEMVRVME